MFGKKSVLKNFIKFTGKHLCQSLFLIKFIKNFIKKEVLAHVFFCEFYEIFKNTFFYRTHLAATSEYICENDVPGHVPFIISMEL